MNRKEAIIYNENLKKEIRTGCIEVRFREICWRLHS